MVRLKEIILPGQKPSELKRHPTIGPNFLQRFPDDLLARGEEDGRPWLFLASLPKISDEERRFFEMAVSVSEALKNLGLMMSGLAHRKASKPLKLHPDAKLYRRLKQLGHQFTQEPPAELEPIASKHDRDAAKRSKGNRIAAEPDGQMMLQKYPEHFFMILNWLTWGDQGIGLGFFDKQVLVDVMQYVFPGRDAGDAEKYYSDRVRARLKLKAFNPRKPVVVASRLLDDSGMISVQYREKSGDAAKTNRYLLQPIHPFYPSKRLER